MSGWNPAAEKLGYSPPAWIARHGSARGQCELSIEGDHMRIAFVNDVKFTSQVQGLPARVQTAVDWQTRDMLRRVDAFAKKDRKL